MTLFNTSPSISTEAALALVSAALAFAKSQGLGISVAVCGSELQTIALLRGDAAPPHSLETAKRKAQTAAARKQESGFFDETFAIALPLATDNRLTNLRGGLPIVVHGVYIGGIGIGGGSPEQDVAVAKAALKQVLE